MLSSLGSSALGSSALGSTSGVLSSDAGSSVVETGSSVIGSSTTEVVGSSAEVFNTIGSSEIGGVLETVAKVLGFTDQAGGFLGDILGWLPFF